MVFLLSCILPLLLRVAVVQLSQVPQVRAVAEDWIANPPLTAYETEPIRFQNEDFDIVNNLFRVQTQYVANELVLHYKFRVYSDQEGYSGIASNTNIPMNKVYLMTNNNELTGVIGRPILAYHHIDNSEYSDFAQLILVPAPTNFYEPDLFRSELDVLQSGQSLISTGIVVNMPLVPINSRLQDPRELLVIDNEISNNHNKNNTAIDATNTTDDKNTTTTRTRQTQTTTDTRVAPIDPVIAWYKGVDAWMYVLETNDARGADFFAYTRPQRDSTNNTNNIDGILNIHVNPDFAVVGRIQSNPLYFLNAYTKNVIRGQNNGGPNSAGMRNIVPFHRVNPQYSSLVQLNWVKSVPMDFSADQATSVDDLTGVNGFQTEPVAWFINAPILGPVVMSSSNNSLPTTPTTTKSFLASVSVNQNSSRIMGSEWTFRNIEGLSIQLLTPQGNVLAETQTDQFGVYEMTVSSSTIPPGISVVYLRSGGVVFRTLDVNDYIGGPPPTVYESQTTTRNKTPSQYGYNAEKQIFLAHTLWYNDRLTHMYMFYMYSAKTSPNSTTAESSTADLPFNTLYVVTRSDLTEIIGAPIVVNHHMDGEFYSDYMQVVYVRPPTGYTPNAYRSEGDVLNSNAETVTSGIFVNAPIVPNGSALQDPMIQGDATINVVPNEFWFRGAKVQAFVLEATDEIAVTAFDPNRALTLVTKSFVSENALKAVPLYFLNQYTNGVTTSNVGGPHFGMRNIIDAERADGDSYSSLRQVFWVNDLPINYVADQVSSTAPLLSDQYGFTVENTPIWINAPCVGVVDTTTTNPALVDPTALQPELSFVGTNIIVGSSPALVFVANATVRLETPSGARIQTTVTNDMGGYQFALLSVAIPRANNEIVVVATISSEDEEEDETILIRTLQTPNRVGGSELSGGVRCFSLFSWWSVSVPAVTAMILILVV